MTVIISDDNGEVKPNEAQEKEAPKRKTKKAEQAE